MFYFLIILLILLAIGIVFRTWIAYKKFIVNPVRKLLSSGVKRKTVTFKLRMDSFKSDKYFTYEDKSESNPQG